MYSKLLIFISVTALFCSCSSNKSETKENQTIEKTEVVKVEAHNDDTTTTKSTAKVFSLEKDKKEFKYLLSQHHDKHKNDVNLEILSKKLNSSDPGERQDGVYLLRFFPEYSSLVPKVEELLLQDKEASLRNECAITLQLLESTRSIPALIKALEDEDIQVKTSTIESLAALGEKENCFAAADKLWNKGKEGGPVQACQAAFRDIATQADKRERSSY
jgi:HEAT repeat protein